MNSGNKSFENETQDADMQPLDKINTIVTERQKLFWANEAYVKYTSAEIEKLKASADESNTEKCRLEEENEHFKVLIKETTNSIALARQSVELGYSTLSNLEDLNFRLQQDRENWIEKYNHLLDFHKNKYSEYRKKYENDDSNYIKLHNLKIKVEKLRIQVNVTEQKCTENDLVQKQLIDIRKKMFYRDMVHLAENFLDVTRGKEILVRIKELESKEAILLNKYSKLETMRVKREMEQKRMKMRAVDQHYSNPHKNDLELLLSRSEEFDNTSTLENLNYFEMQNKMFMPNRDSKEILPEKPVLQPKTAFPSITDSIKRKLITTSSGFSNKRIHREVPKIQILDVKKFVGNNLLNYSVPNQENEAILSGNITSSQKKTQDPVVVEEKVSETNSSQTGATQIFADLKLNKNDDEFKKPSEVIESKLKLPVLDTSEVFNNINSSQTPAEEINVQMDMQCDIQPNSEQASKIQNKTEPTSTANGNIQTYEEYYTTDSYVNPDYSYDIGILSPPTNYEMDTNDTSKNKGFSFFGPSKSNNDGPSMLFGNNPRDSDDLFKMF